MTNDIEIISRKEAKERGLNRYFTGKPCKRGHITERQVSDRCCCECKAKRSKEHYSKNKDKIAEYLTKNKDKLAERRKERYTKNKDKILDRNKGYYANNRDAIAEQKKEYRSKNKDKRSEWSKEYYKKNKDTINERSKAYGKNYRKKNKDKISKYNKEWRQANSATYFIRSSLKRIFNDWKGSRKKMEKLHGYTFEQLKQRIEFQFKDGMSWDNRSEWHIDHRKPISRFLDQGVTDPKIINALSNLQPMWASENLSKGAKFEL